MSEAKDDSTQNPKHVTMSVAEIHSLADRLEARARSILLRDQPQQASDMARAARIIRLVAQCEPY
jgi:hypothetical protein